MPLDLSDDERAQLAKDLAAELDTGLYGNRAVLSRRQLLSIAGGSAGVAGLVALGVDPATAQSAAGQVGTQSSPEDVFAFDLDVQGALQRDLDAGGQAISNVGSLSTNDATITESFQIDKAKQGAGTTAEWGLWEDVVDGAQHRLGIGHQFTPVPADTTTLILDRLAGSYLGDVTVYGRTGTADYWKEDVSVAVNEGTAVDQDSVIERGSPPARSYSESTGAVELTISSEASVVAYGWGGRVEDPAAFE